MSVLDAAIQTVGSIGSQLIGSAFSRHAQKEANKRNMEHNERNIQNEWDMWNATNAYNSPSAQAQRYAEAGLNPLLVGSESGLANLSSAPSSIPNQSIGGLEFGALSFANDLKTIAEAKNIQQNTKKQEAETQQTLTYNRFQEQLLSGQVTMQNVQVINTEANTKVQEATSKELWSKIPIWNAQIDQIRAATSLANEQRFDILFRQNLQRAEFDWKKHYDAEQIKVMRANALQLAAQTGLLKSQTGFVNGQSFALFAQNRNAFRNADASTKLLEYNAEEARVIFELDDKFGAAQRKTGMVTSVINAVSSAANAAANTYTSARTGTSFYNQGVQTMQSAGPNTSSTFDPSDISQYKVYE